MGPFLCAVGFGTAKRVYDCFADAEADYGSLAETKSNGVPIQHSTDGLGARVFGAGRGAFSSIIAWARIRPLARQLIGPLARPLKQTAPPSRILLGDAVLNPDNAIPRWLSVYTGRAKVQR